MAAIAAELAMKHLAIVNFVCQPYEEFEEKEDMVSVFLYHAYNLQALHLML